MQFNNGVSCVATATPPTDVQHNCFNSIKIAPRSDTLGSVDSTYAGINMADASANMATQYTKENGHMGLSIHNNNNNNINHKNNNNNDSVSYYYIKTLNNNEIESLTNEKNAFEFSEDNKYGIVSDQSNGGRFETDGDESNESGPIDVVGADGNRNGIGHQAIGNGFSGDEKAPDHHARRPMNAFLIFCKRHRAIVREKYPNLENR